MHGFNSVASTPFQFIFCSIKGANTTTPVEVQVKNVHIDFYDAMTNGNTTVANTIYVFLNDAGASYGSHVDISDVHVKNVYNDTGGPPMYLAHFARWPIHWTMRNCFTEFCMITSNIPTGSGSDVFMHFDNLHLAHQWSSSGGVYLFNITAPSGAPRINLFNSQIYDTNDAGNFIGGQTSSMFMMHGCNLSDNGGAPLNQFNVDVPGDTTRFVGNHGTLY